MQRRKSFILSAALAFSLAAAASLPAQRGPAPPADGTTPVSVLRVALFPYLPDVARDTFRSFRDRIEREFEAAHPDIDLQIRPMDPNDGAFYDTAAVKGWLAGGTYDVVEIDAVMLGDLAAAGVLTPRDAASVDSANWHPGLSSALSYGGKVYGVPHWLCGDFILSRFPPITQSTTSTALTHALAVAPPNQMKLTGSLSGSWTLPALYLHAWADNHGPAGLAGAISFDLDRAAVRQLGSVLKFCAWHNVNTCLDPTFTPDSTVAMYAKGESDAFIGFSERLTAIMMKGVDGSTIHLSPAPLGPADNVTLLYVDALVRRQNCDSACHRRATAFERYLLSDATYQWMLTSADAGSPAIPRYLLPATVSAFDVPGVSGDPHFREMRAAIVGGVPFPNRNFAAARKAMQQRLLQELTQN